MGPHLDSGLRQTPLQQQQLPLQPDPIVENAFDPLPQQPGTPIDWHELLLTADLQAAVAVVVLAFQAIAMVAVFARGNLFGRESLMGEAHREEKRTGYTYI